jgi:two-component system, OmpR family, phosphate regulon response regulator PhoB
VAYILLAEDEANIHTLVSFRLKRLGHEITWAQDGKQALEAVRGHRPDLILLDVMMPGLDGFQVLQQLKADGATQDIPVIMLTARGHEKDVGIGLAGGADDYIVKPFSFNELLARINALLARPTGDKMTR